MPETEMPPKSEATAEPSDSRSCVIDVQKLSRSFGATEVLRDVTLCIGAGERVAVIGPSGAGKTTLLRLISGVLWPTAGGVEVLGKNTAELRGRELREFRRQLGVLYQNDNLVPGLRVVHNVLMGKLGHWSALRSLASLLVPQQVEIARAALREVELEDKLWALPATLSGGQQQRVAIARLLVQEPLVMLADEPVSSLDMRLGRDVVHLICQTAVRQEATLLVSLHSLDLLDDHFDRILALRDGRLHWDGTPAQLTRELLREIYGAEYRSLHLDEIELGRS